MITSSENLSQNASDHCQDAGWEEFASPSALSRCIINATIPVQLDAIPTRTFAFVDLGMFEFIIPDSAAETPALSKANPSTSGREQRIILDNCVLVDGVVSCGFHQECTLTPMQGFQFCRHHHKAVARAIVFFGPRRKKKAQEDGFVYQQDVIFHRPARERLPLFSTLHTMHATYTIWTIDVEFCIVKAANAIPFSLCIRDMKTHEIIVYTSIDYGMTLDEVEAAIKQNQVSVSGPDVTSALWATRNYFQKFYTGDRTHGMNLSGVGDVIRKAGFDPNTHRLLSCYNSHDLNFYIGPCLEKAP